MGQKPMIPTLPESRNTTTFTAADLEPDIKGNHLDVSTGEGKNAGRKFVELLVMTTTYPYYKNHFSFTLVVNH